MSKRDVLMALSTMNFEDVTVGDVTVTTEDFNDYIASSIESLDKRNEAAKKRAAEKKQAGDELRAAIKATITGNTKSISEILTALNDDTVTSAMVVSRLGQLCKLGEVVREDTNVDGRKIKVYTAVDATPEF